MLSIENSFPVIEYFLKRRGTEKSMRELEIRQENARQESRKMVFRRVCADPSFTDEQIARAAKISVSDVPAFLKKGY